MGNPITGRLPKQLIPLLLLLGQKDNLNKGMTRKRERQQNHSGTIRFTDEKLSP